MRNPLHVNDKARKQGILLPKFKTRVTVPPPPPHEGLLSFKNYKKRKKIAANIQRIISTQMSFRCQYRWGGGGGMSGPQVRKYEHQSFLGGRGTSYACNGFLILTPQFLDSLPCGCYPCTFPLLKQTMEPAARRPYAGVYFPGGVWSRGGVWSGGLAPGGGFVSQQQE